MNVRNLPNSIRVSAFSFGLALITAAGAVEQVQGPEAAEPVVAPVAPAAAILLEKESKLIAPAAPRNVQSLCENSAPAKAPKVADRNTVI